MELDHDLKERQNFFEVQYKTFCPMNSGELVGCGGHFLLSVVRHVKKKEFLLLQILFY